MVHAGSVYSSDSRDARIAALLQPNGQTLTPPGWLRWPPRAPPGAGLRQARNILKGRYPISLSGGLPMVDVRDVAKVHAAVLAPGRGSRRYLASGTFRSPTSSQGSRR